MARVRVPDRHRPVFSILLGWSETQRNEFVAALAALAPNLSITNLASALSAHSPFSEEQADVVIEMLTSMLSATQAATSVDDFVSRLCADLSSGSDATLQPKNGNWRSFESFLKNLLTCNDVLRLAAKTREVRAEHEHVYCHSRILTDIRPIFQDDVHQSPEAATLIHMLKIMYHDADSHKECFFALDDQDLRQLRDQVDRAINKEKTLQKLLANMKIANLDPSEG